MEVIKEQKKSRFILLTPKDPWLPPSGGTSSFAKQIMEVYKEEISIASMTTLNNLPLGRWIEREFGETKINFFGLGKNIDKKTFLPARLNFLYCVFRFRKNLSQVGVKKIFVDSPETIIVLDKNWESLCYMFHGLNDPIKHGRYKFLQWLGYGFEKIFLWKLKKLAPDCVLAAADNQTIEEFSSRTQFQKRVGRKINSFPTRVDNRIFYPQKDIEALRKSLNLNEKIILTNTGRLAQIKGWDLLLNSFKLLLEKKPCSKLVFVGDGEDRKKIELAISQMRIESNVLLTGFVNSNKVAEYINASDLCLVGSYREGWSVAMCEALACGKGLISTNVSGVSNMIEEGKNGYVSYNRNPQDYCNLIIKALALKDKETTSLNLSKKYLLTSLKGDLEKTWKF